jgi:hypothetical protein
MMLLNQNNNSVWGDGEAGEAGEEKYFFTVTCHLSPVTCYQSPLFLRKAKIVN